MKHAFLILLLSVFTNAGISQTSDSVYYSSLDKPRPINVVTTDTKSYSGMAMDITTDYVLIDLSSKKSIMVNTPYYLRPAGKYYRIDVEYIQVISTRKKKGVGKAALVGGLGGMVGFSSLAYANRTDDDDSGDFFAAAGIGFVIGTLVGTITGLLTHKKWQVHGSSVQLAAFRDEYF